VNGREPSDLCGRLVDVWADWERSYREPLNGWTGVEEFREWFVRDRDAMAARVRASTPESIADDAPALRHWIAAGGDLRVAVRGVDNMAEARARMLANVDTLLDDLAEIRPAAIANSVANSGKTVRKNSDLRRKRGSNGVGAVQRIPAVPVTSPPKSRRPVPVKVRLKALLDEMPDSERRRIEQALDDADRQLERETRQARQRKTFALRVRELRGDVKQTAFGAPLGVRDKEVSSWEHAHTSGRMPKLEIRVEIAERYGKERGYLIVETLDDDDLAELTSEEIQAL
jgi:hypothetical protein